MATYGSLISRNDASALIPEQVSNSILANLSEQSAALRLFRQMRMSTNQTRMPVLAALPTAYFVDGDTGLKQTSEVNWDNKYLNVAELAVIIPIPEAVLDDAQFDVWGAVQPLAEQAIGRALDAAIFFGTNKPSNWPTAIVTAATSASQTVARGTNAANAGGIAEDINDLMATVEASGFDPNGFVTSRVFRQYLRGARDSSGQRLLDIDGRVDNIEGLPVTYSMSGLWPSGTSVAEMVTGDFNQGIVGLRQDMTWKLLDQAVIQDSTGAIQYNLAQQDMVAMRLVFRVAFQVANTINYTEETEGNRYPFAVMLSPSGE